MRLTFDEIFAPTYKGKLFQVKPGHVAYSIEFDADPITPEGKDIQRLVKAHWKEEMAAFKKEKEKLYSEAINATEKNINKTFAKKWEKEKDEKKLEHWLEEEVKGANVMIRNAIQTFESTVKSRAKKIFDTAAAKVDKKYKSNLRGRKFKAGLKIIAHVSLILAAGAVAIAATAAGVALTVGTGGIGALSFAVIAPAVLTVLTAAFNSAKGIHTAVKKEWPNLDKATEKLETTIKDLKAAVVYTKKKKLKKDTIGKLTPKDKFKLLFTDVKGKVKTAESTLLTCGNYCGRLRQNIEKMAKDVTSMQTQIDKLIAASKKEPKVQKKLTALSKKQARLLYEIEKARLHLEKLDPIVREGLKLVNSTDIEDEKKLSAFLNKINRIRNDGSVKLFMTEAKNVLTETGSVIAKVVT
jgi:cell division protein FtsB